MNQQAAVGGDAGTGVRGIAAALNRHNDIALAVLVVAVISLMILPLSPIVLDTLIAANLAASVTLLMLSLYIPSALGLSTFPSLLLFTTLFRLSLNIASTKQILLNANAGHIIDTFGKLVVGGSVIVGGVVFMIIAIVQFIVIAKGSERVAEVGARFTLDAMPGKQMSIDADLRAGIIGAEEARSRRALIEQESQLHGAMDGAMKFVKGDAIASIIIALVNILAGIAIGALVNGMSAAEALERYAILTVGDGMVSQIPSLFVSIAAGVVITRVSTSEAGTTHLGGEIGRQVLAQPMALLITGGILMGFLLVPGFPKPQFAFLGLAIGCAST
jgi:type III secretion protein V